MNRKKNKCVLAAILAASLVFTGCGLPFEIRMKDSGESSAAESSNSIEFKNSDEFLNPVGQTNPSESSGAASAESDASSKASTGEANYEPVTVDCSEIYSSGDTRYFDLTYQYGDACSIMQRYIYKNGSYDGGSLKILPGTETDLATIINNVNVLEGGSPSDFAEVLDGWTMTREATEEEKTVMNMDSIENMRTFIWAMTMMSQGYSQEEAEAIAGASSQPTMPYVVDDFSSSMPSGITLDDVSYALFGADGTTILFQASYAGEFTIEEKLLFESSGSFKSLETTLITGSVSDTDEIFATLESLYDDFDPDDYTLSEQSATKYTMYDSVPTRSFFLGSDLASMSGATYSVVYSVLSDAL